MIIDLIQGVVDGIIDGSLIAIAAIGISLVFSVQRFANVSQACLMSAGAYFAWFGLSLGLGMWFALGFSMVSGALLGVLVFLLAFRPLRKSSKVALLVASIGVDLFIRYGIALVWGRKLRGYQIGNPGSFYISEIQISWIGVGITAVALVTMAAVWLLLKYTRIGREMRAVADNPELARIVRISENTVYLWTWALVGVTAAIAGVCIGLRSSVYPDLGWEALLIAFAAAIFGGLGEIRGAVIGGILMGIVGSVASLYVSPTFKPAFGFIVMALVLLIRPQGLLGRRARV